VVLDPRGRATGSRTRTGRLHPRAVACRGQNLAIAAAETLIPFDTRACPCCGWRGLRFRSFAVAEALRTGVICPGCGSFERHRALASFYPAFFAERPVRPSRLLHFAPEPCLRRALMPLCDHYVTSAYGETVPADLRLDVTAMAQPDASCDALILNHVLDCIPADRAAIAEMDRVLRPGGVVLAVVTIERGVATREVPVTGNSLHRVYGSADLGARFAPFTVSLADAADGLGQAIRRRHGIAASVPVLVLRK
jgi:SAM-dependent methyltransferase